MEMRMKRVFIAVAALALGTGAAVAGTDDNNKAHPPGFKEGNKTGWDDGRHPPGWDQGEKKGWDGDNHPPGREAKKDDNDDHKKDKY
jgi:hypothetical protein